MKLLLAVLVLASAAFADGWIVTVPATEPAAGESAYRVPGLTVYTRGYANIPHAPNMPSKEAIVVSLVTVRSGLIGFTVSVFAESDGVLNSQSCYAALRPYQNRAGIGACTFHVDNLKGIKRITVKEEKPTDTLEIVY